MRKGEFSHGKEASMDVQPDLKYVYGWNHYTMRFMGIWPEERKWNQPSSYLALIPVLMMFLFVCVPQTINLSFIWGDFNLVVENLSMGNITITISLLKTIAFWINGKPLKSLLKCMADDWSTVSKKDDLDTMSNIARITRKTIISSTVLCHIVVITYIFLRFLTRKYSGTRLLFRAYFPYDSDVSPNYEFTVIAQIIAAFYAATTYTAVDTFIVMLILHVCGQLSNLRNEFGKLQACDKVTLQAKLGKIVQKHEYLNRFAETIERCFNMMLLIQMLGCTVQLCFQCFQAVMSIDEEIDENMIFQILFLLFYVVYVMLQLFLYCYVGERLSVESVEIANAAYDSEWYNLSPKNAKLLLIIMRRARLPLQITAGRFATFTLMLYSQILKTSVGKGYVSVLYAMKYKETTL
ncbi:PREDICTED: odorant receptor 67c-like [Habropoda laboriosa]|uniref:odorant receptor 67c-like n=1 Tax=Habropoda laboriosa TaxID=597456 RepID=UPI00083D5183|nr:PREDICTED: odorant receptor 67c-like [Habropoda laboriosa]